MDLFMLQKTVSMPFFTDCCTQNIFLLESQDVSTTWTVFNSGL